METQGLTPPPQSPENGNPEHQNTKDNHWITILSMAVFVILSLGAVSFLYFQNMELKKMIASNQSLTSPTPTSIQTPDPTLGWKTYASEAFSFRYPGEAELREQPDTIAISFMGNKQKESGRTQTELFDGYAFNVWQVKDAKSESLSEFADSRIQDLTPVCTEVGNLSESTVSGVRALTHRLVCLGDYDAYYVKGGDKYYEITLLYVGDEEDQPGYELITKQILSTFRFTQ
jgi:hypothetical protein